MWFNFLETLQNMIIVPERKIIWVFFKGDYLLEVYWHDQGECFP
jgi:hypothetical protein